MIFLNHIQVKEYVLYDTYSLKFVGSSFGLQSGKFLKISHVSLRRMYVGERGYIITLFVNHLLCKFSDGLSYQ